MDISIPVTLQYPGRTVITPFGNNEIPGEEVEATVVLHIDEDTAADIQELLKAQ
jgi:hypothetical protein